MEDSFPCQNGEILATINPSRRPQIIWKFSCGHNFGFPTLCSSPLIMLVVFSSTISTLQYDICSVVTRTSGNIPTLVAA